MSSNYTIEQQRDMYKHNEWGWSTPSVQSSQWNDDDWIQWINCGNRWMPNATWSTRK